METEQQRGILALEHLKRIGVDVGVSRTAGLIISDFASDKTKKTIYKYSGCILDALMNRFLAGYEVEVHLPESPNEKL